MTLKYIEFNAIYCKKAKAKSWHAPSEPNKKYAILFSICTSPYLSEKRQIWNGHLRPKGNPREHCNY